MSAHLTVYAMAIEAERAVRMWEVEQASRMVLAEASSQPRSGRLLRRLGAAIRQVRGSGDASERWTGSGNRAFPVVGQPAS